MFVQHSFLFDDDGMQPHLAEKKYSRTVAKGKRGIHEKRRGEMQWGKGERGRKHMCYLHSDLNNAALQPL
jgi:hypothetical protein